MLVTMLLDLLPKRIFLPLAVCMAMPLTWPPAGPAGDTPGKANKDTGNAFSPGQAPPEAQTKKDSASGKAGGTPVKAQKKKDPDTGNAFSPGQAPPPEREPGPGDPGEPIRLPHGPRLEILNVVVQEHRANLGRIRTWAGTATIADRIKYQQKLVASTDFAIDFVVDRVGDAYRWNRKTLQAMAVDNGKELTTAPAELRLEGGMRKGDDFYRNGPRTAQATGQIVNVNGANAINLGPASTDFDPLYYLTDYGMNLAERFQYFYEYSGSPSFNWKTEHRGNRVIVQSEVAVSINRYVVDLSRGATLAESYQLTRDDSGNEVQESKFTFECENVAGVWVPKRVTFYNEDRIRETRLDRTIDYQTQHVNGPLSDDAFSLAALGVRPGDEIVDMRSGVRATVPGAPHNLVPLSGPQPTAVSPLLWGALFVNVLLVAALIAWWLRRQSSSARRRRDG
jgi:hypothetical protein